MNSQLIRRAWGQTAGLLGRSRSLRWVDICLVVGVIGLGVGFLQLGREVTGEFQPKVIIDLSLWSLPKYTFFSASRGLIAYIFSLLFTLLYGYWAAKDAVAETVLIPLLDILQSIPVLGFMPGVLLALLALFPHSNVGVELSAVLMIFTGQVWNMTFSFFHSIKSVPKDMLEAATIYRFSGWQRFAWVELPFTTMGLVWNSMMSMAGGWFFLMIIETFKLGERDCRLPGIGSYMKKAVDEGEGGAIVGALFAMTVMIVAFDQFLWRPVVVMAQKYRVEEGGQQEAMSSWFLNLLRRSRIIEFVHEVFHHLGVQIQKMRGQSASRQPMAVPVVEQVSYWPRVISLTGMGLLGLGLLYGSYSLIVLISSVSFNNWRLSVMAAMWTLGRVLIATVVGTLWTLPAGLAIGLSPRLSRILQPVIQVAASFPAPMLFPLVIAAMHWFKIPLGVGSIVLMLLGTQWYIMFNVIAGTMAIPADLKEATTTYRMGRWQRFCALYLPAVFPYLVTGWVTAAGGAWNASIVAEYVDKDNHVLSGLGSQISQAADKANFPLLAASIIVMAVLVVTFNRTVWQYMYRLASERYSLDK